AARVLVAEGFQVLPYINADPVLARKPGKLGTVTVMPLGSPIGSGPGLRTLERIRIIVEGARAPVAVTAGSGGPSDAPRAAARAPRPGQRSCSCEQPGSALASWRATPCPWWRRRQLPW